MYEWIIWSWWFKNYLNSFKYTNCVAVCVCVCVRDFLFCIYIVFFCCCCRCVLCFFLSVYKFKALNYCNNMYTCVCRCVCVCMCVLHSCDDSISLNNKCVCVCVWMCIMVQYRGSRIETRTVLHAYTTHASTNTHAHTHTKHPLPITFNLSFPLPHLLQLPRNPHKHVHTGRRNMTCISIPASKPPIDIHSIFLKMFG